MVKVFHRCLVRSNEVDSEMLTAYDEAVLLMEATSLFDRIDHG